MDEAAYIPTTKWMDFVDGVLPSQSSLAWKKTIFLSTPNGMNHFYDIVEGAKKHKFLENVSKSQIPSNALKVTQNSDDTYTAELPESSNNFKLITVDWKDVPRYNSKGARLDPEDFKREVIEKNGVVFFQQAYGMSFIGSSYTLIEADTLKKLKPQRPQDYYTIPKCEDQFLVYREPEEQHKYILAVDPAKDGQDYFAMQLVDITTFPFVEVGAAKLQVDYLLMPQFICDLGTTYNDAFIVIENNEGSGQSIADTLLRDFDYSNLYYDKDSKNRNKTYPGFRTTTKSRSQLLNTLKLLVENDKLIINDNNTIKELFTFVLKGSKFQADEGFHDDMVMSLALAFCLFLNVDNFEDMREMVDAIYHGSEDLKFTDILTVGSFGDFNDDTVVEDQEFYQLYGINND